MTALGITLPLRITQRGESFAIEDAAGRSVAHVYFCDDEQRRGVTRRVSQDEARRIAQVTARALTEAAETQKAAPRPEPGRRSDV